MNKELQTQREHQDLRLSRHHEESNQLRADYEKQLLAKQSEIHELEDMKHRLVAKEEIEEKLVSEKEEVMLHLNKVQHQLATLQSEVGGHGGHGGHGGRGGTDGVTISEAMDYGGSVEEAREDLLERELRERTHQCQQLKIRYVHNSSVHVYILPHPRQLSAC